MPDKTVYALSRLKQYVKDHPGKTALHAAALFAVLFLVVFSCVSLDLDKWYASAAENICGMIRETSAETVPEEVMERMLTDEQSIFSPGRYCTFICRTENGEFPLKDRIQYDLTSLDADALMKEEDLIRLAQTVCDKKYRSGLLRIYVGKDSDDQPSRICAVYSSYFSSEHSQTVNPYTKEPEQYGFLHDYEEVFAAALNDHVIESYSEGSMKFPYLSSPEIWQTWKELNEHPKTVRAGWKKDEIYTVDDVSVEIHAAASPLKETAWIILRMLILASAAVLIARYALWAYRYTKSEHAKIRETRRDSINAIAHEMRTPLASIIGSAEMLKMGVMEEKKELYIDRIIEKGNEMDQLINDMISLAKLDDAEIAMVREEININELIDDMKGNYQEAEFLIEEKGTMRIIADIAYIRRMLKCLLDNAVRCRTAGTPVTVQITESELKIHNVCEKLSPAELKDIFRFRQRADGHYSFGLYFSRKAAEKNGLKLYLYNDKDGVTVSLLRV
ncbi:MAG: HAMP domain-containing histidine kinase [Solobacterium sp.]|nr:HAMP domain-containing histidine kinase [Solobacterium sp.]